jgi:signal transduction histidine kinase
MNFSSLVKSLVFLFFMLSQYKTIFAQNGEGDSLKNQLNLASTDSARWQACLMLTNMYAWRSPDSAMVYGKKAQNLARQMNSPEKMGQILCEIGWINIAIGDFGRALYVTQEAAMLGRQSKDPLLESYAKTIMSIAYLDIGDNLHALESELSSYSLSLQNNDKDLNEVFHHLSAAYRANDKLDSALFCITEAERLCRLQSFPNWSPVKFEKGNVYSRLNQMDSAAKAYHEGVIAAERLSNYKDLLDNLGGLAEMFSKTGIKDSAIFYANMILEKSETRTNSIVRLNALKLLVDIYKSDHKKDSLSKYRDLYYDTNDSLFSKRKVMQMKDLSFAEETRQKELEAQRTQYQNRLRIYMLTGGLIAFILLATLLYHNNIQRQKAQARIEQAYLELKSTQAKLIQSEKMASLGELTAGIAHEIQNPLNFVNNFSEVNAELGAELKEQIQNENYQEASKIATEIVNNEQKIIHHGKRADSIVKNMLLHSRTSSGQQELTDINALASEYLRLTFQGQRAKDETFNATIKTDFDNSIGKIKIIPQDIGRVLVNIYNNAFYAVGEKRKKNANHYEPTINVSTKKSNERVEIVVNDNGTGILPKVKDKIFQPFFTTKPSGQGTGLGLSLSYDIVKAHNGEIRVVSEEGEGSQFIIQLPVG